jgi:c-di-GMP-binding flagellar brake protein YcgR
MRGLPEQGQEVYVIAPSGAAITARVRDAGASCTTLSFEENASDPVAVLAGGNVAVQYTNRRGVCRIDGLAHKAPGIGALRVDYTSKIQLIQRREFVRVDAMLRVTYEPLGPSGWTAETTTTNVSGGGCMISGREGLHIDEVMPFCIELDGDIPEAGPLEILGRVVRETDGGLGIRIEQITDDERERLIRWVFARERQNRQIVRGL